MNTSRRILAIARALGRNLLRRRAALTLLALLPGAFYMTVQGQEVAPGDDPWTLNIGVIGIAWAVAGGAFFLALSASKIDARLLLAGNSRTELLVGRIVFLLGFAGTIAAFYAVFLVALSEARWLPLTLAVTSTALIAMFLGLFLAALLPRELEGTITLILIIGIQSSVPVDSAMAPFLPFYGAMELVSTSWAGGDIGPWLTHVATVMAVLLVGTAIAWRRATWFRPLTPRATTKSAST